MTAKKVAMLVMVVQGLGCSSTPAEDQASGEPLADGPAVLAATDEDETLDCQRFDSYMASLATLTANCLGSVDPRSYELDDDGFLVPTFDACRDGDNRKLRSIRQLLSLQHRSALLPSAKACMAGRYATARAKFEEAGAPMCPKWEFVRTENPISEEVVARVQNQLPKLPSIDPLPAGILDGDRPALRTINLYAVSFAEVRGVGSSPGSVAIDSSSSERASNFGPGCDGPSSCGKLCTSTFPGFFVGLQQTADGRDGILTDPDSWLDSTVYASASADPYLSPVFYHPMSYRFVQFGDPNRAVPCGRNPDGTPVCIPEACSYFSGSSHKKVRLQLDCNDYSNPATCMSYCGPPLPPPPALPAL